jgi:hypothetical protein
LEPNNTKLLEWFRILVLLGVADGIALANKLKKNGKLPQFYRRRCTSEGFSWSFEYCFSLGIACYVCNRE